MVITDLDTTDRIDKKKKQTTHLAKQIMYTHRVKNATLQTGYQTKTSRYSTINIFLLYYIPISDTDTAAKIVSCATTQAHVIFTLNTKISGMHV